MTFFSVDFYEDEDEDSPGLPTKNDEEFKPFIRKLPEFKFWSVFFIGFFNSYWSLRFLDVL